MKGHDLLKGLSFVDEQYVEEANGAVINKKHFGSWLRLTAMAACMCIIIAGAFAFWDGIGFSSGEGALQENGDRVNGMESAEEVEEGTNLPQEAEGGTVETPSLILRIDSWTSDGFIGTVEETTDTQLLPVGTQVRAVINENTENKNSTYDRNSSKSYGAGEVGGCVVIQFSDYDPESQTIYVEQIDPVQ